MVSVILLLFAIQLLINIIQLRFAKPGSDHFIHFGIINTIISSKQKFITRVDTFLNDRDFPDPVLYHVLLSFLPAKLLDRYKYFGLIFNLLSLGFFICFLVLIFPFVSVVTDRNTFILIAGLLYIFTPFEYFSWNAKNVGLSARGFGLMLGHLFVYAITLYTTSQQNTYFYLAIFFAYLILLSSQFAFQFVIFFSIIFSVFSQSILIMLIPVFATLMLFITLPAWAKNFFSRQWDYKRMYFNIISKRFGLKTRYSVWRDFVYDFWVSFKEKNLVRAIEYFYRNPVVELVIGFPILGVLTLDRALFGNTASGTAIFYPIVGAALIIFLLTSFRLTRFIGEPQRYVEFVFPVLCILPLFNHGYEIVPFILIPSFVIIVLEIVVIHALARRAGGGMSTHEKTLDLLAEVNRLNADSAASNRVICNNGDVLKYFADKNYKIVNVQVCSESTGELHFNDIFPENYGNMSLPAFLHLAKWYKVNWLILDEKLISKQTFAKTQEAMLLKEMKSVHHFTIYQTC